MISDQQVLRGRYEEIACSGLACRNGTLREVSRPLAVSLKYRGRATMAAG